MIGLFVDRLEDDVEELFNMGRYHCNKDSINSSFESISSGSSDSFEISEVSDSNAKYKRRHDQSALRSRKWCEC